MRGIERASVSTTRAHVDNARPCDIDSLNGGAVAIGHGSQPRAPPRQPCARLPRQLHGEARGRGHVDRGGVPPLHRRGAAPQSPAQRGAAVQSPARRGTAPWPTVVARRRGAVPWPTVTRTARRPSRPHGAARRPGQQSPARRGTRSRNHGDRGGVPPLYRCGAAGPSGQCTSKPRDRK